MLKKSVSLSFQKFVEIFSKVFLRILWIEWDSDMASKDCDNDFVTVCM